MQKTLKNLAAAFVGESQARNRYTFYSSIAKKEGYEQIADVFRITAEQEKQHASWLIKMINQIKEDEEEIEVTAGVPTTRGTTTENLKAAIAGENYEYTSMYPEFAQIAEEEGLDDIAKRLRSIAVAEEHHEERFTKLLKNLENEVTFKRDEKVQWSCRECGYIHEGEEAPEICPSCDHPQAFYSLKREDY